MLVVVLPPLPDWVVPTRYSVIPVSSVQLVATSGAASARTKETRQRVEPDNTAY